MVDGEAVCFVETGRRLAADVRGRFLADPPLVTFASPSLDGLAGKLAFERERLMAWFGS